MMSILEASCILFMLIDKVVWTVIQKVERWYVRTLLISSHCLRIQVFHLSRQS